MSLFRFIEKFITRLILWAIKESGQTDEKLSCANRY